MYDLLIVQSFESSGHYELQRYHTSYSFQCKCKCILEDTQNRARYEDIIEGSSIGNSTLYYLT